MRTFSGSRAFDGMGPDRFIVHLRGPTEQSSFPASHRRQSHPRLASRAGARRQRRAPGFWRLGAALATCSCRNERAASRLWTLPARSHGDASAVGLRRRTEDRFSGSCRPSSCTPYARDVSREIIASHRYGGKIHRTKTCSRFAFLRRMSPIEKPRVRSWRLLPRMLTGARFPRS
jgi:hypothetical protein